MNQHLALGATGEVRATRFIESLGFSVLERNWRCHAGELDIVALDGEIVVIVEVKTRRNLACGHPFEALTPVKIARLYRLAVLWSVAHEWRGPFRIDAVSVVLPVEGDVHIEYLRGVHA